MKILVACEESQAVCKAFRKRGHEAYSCDIEPCSGGHPEWHLQVDAAELLKMQWDMIIAFPPCTYMTNAGAVRMRVNGEIVQERFEKAMEAKAFFMMFYEADCPKIAIENPTPHEIDRIAPHTSRRYSRINLVTHIAKELVYGLRALPKLQATKILESSTSLTLTGDAKTQMGTIGNSRAGKSVVPK